MSNSSAFSDQEGYGVPQGGYGVPQGGFGFPQGGYGVPQGGFGVPQGGFGFPQGGFGFPPAMGSYPPFMPFPGTGGFMGSYAGGGLLASTYVPGVSPGDASGVSPGDISTGAYAPVWFAESVKTAGTPLCPCCNHAPRLVLNPNHLNTNVKVECTNEKNFGSCPFRFCKFLHLTSTCGSSGCMMMQQLSDSLTAAIAEAERIAIAEAERMTAFQQHQAAMAVEAEEAQRIAAAFQQHQAAMAAEAEEAERAAIHAAAAAAATAAAATAAAEQAAAEQAAAEQAAAEQAAAAAAAITPPSSSSTCLVDPIDEWRGFIQVHIRWILQYLRALGYSTEQLTAIAQKSHIVRGDSAYALEIFALLGKEPHIENELSHEEELLKVLKKLPMLLYAAFLCGEPQLLSAIKIVRPLAISLRAELYITGAKVEAKAHRLCEILENHTLRVSELTKLFTDTRNCEFFHELCPEAPVLPLHPPTVDTVCPDLAFINTPPPTHGSLLTPPSPPPRPSKNGSKGQKSHGGQKYPVGQNSSSSTPLAASRAGNHGNTGAKCKTKDLASASTSSSAAPSSNRKSDAKGGRGGASLSSSSDLSLHSAFLPSERDKIVAVTESSASTSSSTAPSPIGKSDAKGEGGGASPSPHTGSNSSSSSNASASPASTSVTPSPDGKSSKSDEAHEATATKPLLLSLIWADACNEEDNLSAHLGGGNKG